MSSEPRDGRNSSLFDQPGTSNTGLNNEVLSVTALNQAVARTLERSFPLTWISGEVSNFTRAASGHWYFTLKDDGAQVRAVMFRGRAQYAGFVPREGEKLEVRALVTLYAPRGDYQLNVEAIRKAGVGNLYEAFVQLKAKLQAEGLFDADRKKSLPNFVRTVGIITSLQASALRDVLTALRRRAPHVQVILYPCPVQGEGAGGKIAEAIATAEARGECDVLLIVRGGGSMEDLWAFNDEVLARTIAYCEIPTISGVGHETDFTITDFVADLRAATPTAAAELAVRPRRDWLNELQALAYALQRANQRMLDTKRQRLDIAAHRLLSPSARLQRMQMQIDNLRTRLAHGLQNCLEGRRYRLMRQQGKLRASLPRTAQFRQQLIGLTKRIVNAQHHQLSRQKQLFVHATNRLELLNPQRTLERGYAIVTDAEGRVLHSNIHIQAGDTLGIRLASDLAKIEVGRITRDTEK